MTARMVMKMRVAAVRLTTPEVLHVSFVHPARPQLPAWTAGAHVDLRMAGKIRQYSLCGDPADPTRYEVAIKREEAGRGGSAWAHANLVVGAEAHVSAPRNNFPLAAGARENVLVAGGIGITPLLAMARSCEATGNFQLHFCARSAAQAPMLAEVRAVCGTRLQTWFADENRRFDPRCLGPAREGVHLYACGPQRLLDTVKSQGESLGWPVDRIHAEVFQATLDENYKPEPFDVTLASSGAVLHVPADRSLLSVLRDYGITMPSSCELGVCGSCVCGYRDGIVIHRDVVIPVGARQDRIAPCVSRARVAMTLDL